jgi:hypothetical protein
MSGKNWNGLFVEESAAVRTSTGIIALPCIFSTLFFDAMIVFSQFNKRLAVIGSIRREYTTS